MALQVAHRIGVAPLAALDLTVHHVRVLVEADVAEKREAFRRNLEGAWFSDIMARRKKPASLDEVLGWAGKPKSDLEAAKGRQRIKEKRAMAERMLNRWREVAELKSACKDE